MKKPENIIPLFKVFMSEDVIKPLTDVLLSGFIGQGPKVEEFEKILKDYFQNYLVVTTNAGTSASHLAIRLLKDASENMKFYHGVASTSQMWPGIQDGDEALATPLSCTATNWPALANGLKLKWVDVDSNTCNMDLDDLARKITPTTKVILPVHWGGYPCDLDKMAQIQDKAYQMYGFKPAIIEDCAHSFGSTYKGKKIGNHGNICFFSFQAIKHLTTVDGGMLMLPHKQLYDRAKLLRWYGIDRETNSKQFRCLHPQTKIRFADGSAERIVNVVQNKIDKPILAYNEKKNTWVKTKIIGWNTSKIGDRYFIKIKNKRSGNKRCTTITNDHLVFLENKGWIKAENVKTGDKILTSFKKPNKKQIELLTGSILGDGYICSKTNGKTAVFNEGHSNIQKEYVLLKAKALESIGIGIVEAKPNKEQKNPNGKTSITSESTPYMGELRELFYKNGKKVVNKEFLKNYFSEFSLAVWFMDDGCTYVSNTKEGLKYECEIATNSFSEDEIKFLIEILQKFGIESSCKNHSKSGFRLFFNRENSLKLIKKIAKYVPKSMRYKVGHNEYVDKFNEELWKLGEADGYFDNAVVEKYDKTKYDTVYCLTIDGEYKNFASSAICVHNCEDDISEWGYKFHMNDVNATIGIHNFPHAIDVVEKNRANARYFNEKLKDVPGITLLENKDDRESAYWIYTIKVKNRDKFVDYMKECNIMVSRVHERNDKHSCVKEFKTQLPNLDKLVQDMIAIPNGWWIKEEEREYIVECIKKGW